MPNMKTSQVIIFVFFTIKCFAQVNYTSKVWVSDRGDGTYKNPIIHADYSDPDVIRVGSDYYLIASSFDAVPGLPLLHSKDLVNWTIIGHALPRQFPYEHFETTRHGNGVWAPSIRYYHKEFYIYYPDPDFGIYLIKAKSIKGPWTPPILVEAGKGLIDPCPLWDDNGKVYLIHAFAGSRAGIKNILVVKELTPDGSKIKGTGVLVYDGHGIETTVEGPKLYKRHGYYYIFAPAGGVATGWQIVLRSLNIYGPYERKVVLKQGTTTVNGPHQGGWVTTPLGEDWFIHFQDKGAYGRVVFLEPMKWVNGWPVIGNDKEGTGTGEPVLKFRKPRTRKTYSVNTPREDDEFENNHVGLQWQWQANPKQQWAYLYKGNLRMFTNPLPDSANNYWDAPNILLQKFPAEEFTATCKVSFHPNLVNEKFGFIIMGVDYAYIGITKKEDGIYLSRAFCPDADKGNHETEQQIIKINVPDVLLRVTIGKNAICQFSYSLDGKVFTGLNEPFIAKPGKWIGAKIGFFCSEKSRTNDPGYADIDWFRIN